VKKFDTDAYRWFHEFNCLIKERKVYFGSYQPTEDWETGVDCSSAEIIIKNLMYLDSVNSNPIEIHFNSPGGDWWHGMAIYDCIKSLKSKTIFYGYGIVRSMGTIICQACTKRYLRPNCDFMIHAGEDGFMGHSINYIKNAEWSKRINRRMYEIYYDRVIKKDKTMTKKKMEEMCRFDYFMTSKEAVNQGFADKVV